MTPTTSTSVISSVTWTSVKADRMVFDRSPRTSRCTDGGSCASICGSSARTLSVTSIVLTPGWRLLARVEPRRVHVVLDAVEDVRDLIEAHRPSLAVRDDHRLELIGVAQLARRLYVERLMWTVQLSGRQVHVPVLQRLIDFVEPNLLRAQLVRIDLHAHGVLRLSPDLDLRDAVDHREARRDELLGVFVEQRQRRGRRDEAEVQD